MEAQFGNMKFLQGLFKSAKHAAENLGPWASDRVWEHGLREEESDKIERKAERSLLGSSAQVPTGMNGHADQAKGQTQESMGWIDTQLKRIRMAQALVAGFPFEQLQPNPQHLNQKVLRLHTELCRYFERKTNTKCIVFVERRHTARILCDIFREIGTPFLKPGALLGVRKAGDMNVSYRNQVLTLIDFRNGNLNCLFATSIAEEGLDIPDCNLIIRFDLYNTVIQYIQSRGRARHLDSTFVHMIESGNENQRELRGAVHDTERILQAFCQSLPEDRCLDRDGRNTSRMSHRGLYDQTLQIPETGATLTSNSSLAVLAHFAACLNSDQASNSQLNYAIRCQDRMFQAEVFLPDNTLCSIKSAIGIPTPSKAKAKQSAALNACRELIKARLFDKHLNPTFQKLVHCKSRSLLCSLLLTHTAMHGARLAIKGKKTNKYKMLVKPRIWENTWGEVLIPTTGEVPVPTTVIPLYMVVIELRPKAPLSKPHHPIAFLTRTRMPTFPTFPVYLDNDVETAVVSTPVSSPLRLDGSLMARLVAFTFRIYEDCFNKRYIRDPSKMSYWLAPVEHDWQDLSSKDAIGIIDQSVLNLITTDEPILYPKPDEHAVDSLVNKFLLDPNSGQYRYFPIGVEHSLSGDSPIPAHIMPRRKAKTIMEYSLTLWGGARDKFLLAVDKRQPVLKVKLAPIRRNLLDKVSMAEKNVLAEYYVCPRALKVSEVSIFT
jgi:endoribonuclease Dicer